MYGHEQVKPDYKTRVTGDIVLIHSEAEDARKDSIEMPSGGTKDRTPGWKVYVDVMDEAGTRKRIDAAKRAAAYALEPVKEVHDAPTEKAP